MPFDDANYVQNNFTKQTILNAALYSYVCAGESDSNFDRDKLFFPYDIKENNDGVLLS
jgi:hypothetical protein